LKALQIVERRVGEALRQQFFECAHRLQRFT
jgi:hypothetical protein